MNCFNSGGLDKTSAAGGIQAGYNYQASSVVWGLEGSLTDLSGKSSYTFVPPYPGFGGNYHLNFTDEVSWIATARGRIGLAIDRTLVYATAGVAFGHVSHEQAFGGGGVPNFLNAEDGLRMGWTIGGGLEHKLGENWSVKADYLYVDLGKSSIETAPALGAYFVTRSVYDDQLHLINVGLNYHF